jgi:hypothetical protein
VPGRNARTAAAACRCGRCVADSAGSASTGPPIWLGLLPRLLLGPLLLLLHVLQGEAEANEGNERLNAVDGGAVRGDEWREAAGGDDQGVRPLPLVADAADHAVNAVHGAEEDAGADRGIGPATNDMIGRQQFDARQPGGAAHQRFGARADTGRDDATNEGAIR